METHLDPVGLDIPVSSPDTTEKSSDLHSPLSVDTSYDDVDVESADDPSQSISKRPGSSSRRDRKQKQLSPRSREMLRLKINHRERERMHDLNSSMDALRQVMPYAHGPSVKKLSKMATLLLARNYIILLTRSLEEMRRLLAEAYRNQALPPGVGAPGLPGIFPPAGLRLPNLDKSIPGMPPTPTLPGFPPTAGLLSGMPGIPPPSQPPPPGSGLPQHRPLAPGISPTEGLRTSSESSAIPPVTSVTSSTHVVHHPTPTMALGSLAGRNGSGIPTIPSLASHHPHFHHIAGHFPGAPCSCVYCHLAAKSAPESLLKQA